MRTTRPSSFLTLAILTLTLIFLTFSCSTKADLSIGTDRRATINLVVSIPPEIDTWMRRTLGLKPESQLFNPINTASALSKRGLKVLKSSISSYSTHVLSFEASDLAAFIASDTLIRDAGLISYESGPGWASLQLKITSSNALAMLDFFPGLDPELLEALQPPALFYNPVSTAEYRSMLGALMGRSAAAALDTTALNLKLSLPGSILQASGLTIDGGPDSRTASLSVAVVDAMVLEKPIDIYLKWQQ